MPSSLVFSALVVAWLAVLVPVVARRRALVPRPAEVDLSSRVLPRPGTAPVVEEALMSRTVSRTASRPTAAAGRGGRIERSPEGRGGTALADRPGPAVDAADLDELEPLDSAEVEPRFDDEDLDDLDLDDELDELEDLEALDDLDGVDDLDDGYDDVDEDLRRAPDAHDVPAPARPYRPGRGGFDPEAAEAAADARYAFRRRVAVGLIAVAVLAALGAFVLTSTLWWIFGLSVVALAGYLVFLRRQTRIEEDVRARRLARLTGERRALEARRERQAEHRARLEASGEWGAWEDDLDDRDLDELDDELDDLDADDDVVVVAAAGTPRWAAPRTPAPPVPDGLELVEDSEDDPAFHDLDGDRIPAYRRAAGA